MQEIRLRPEQRDVKVRETVQRIPKGVNTIASKIRPYVEDTDEEAPEFVEERMKEYGEDAVHGVTGMAESSIRNAAKKVAEKQRQKEEALRADQRTPAPGEKRSLIRVKQGSEVIKHSDQHLIKTQTVSPSPVGAGGGIQQKQQAAKASKQAAQKAAANTFKSMGEVLKRLIKAIYEAIRELFALIVKGGWVSVVVILVLCVIAGILMSAYGIFWSNESSEGNPMSEIVQRIDAEYRSSIERRITELSTQEEYESVEVVYKGGNNDGDSAVIYNWDDVLAVYAVLMTTDSRDPADVLTVTEETEDRIRELFQAMNSVSFQTEILEEEDTTEDEEEETVIRKYLTIYVTQRAMDYKDAAAHYRLDDRQMELLKELMSGEYQIFFASLIGVDVYGGMDLTEIYSHLPLSGEGAEVVKAALTKLGCPYVWGAKGDQKFDCSGLSYWSIKQVDEALGASMRTNAAGQARYCYTHNLIVGREELQPGDLVFWQNKNCDGCSRWREIHHVGIYFGEGKVVEASSGKGRVVIRVLWESKNYPILMFGRPYGN